MIGYRWFDAGLTLCGDKYEIGKIYTFNEKLGFGNGEGGLVFFKTLKSTLDSCLGNCVEHYCEIEVLGEVVEHPYQKDFCVTNKFKIVKEVELTADLLTQFVKSESWCDRGAVASHYNTSVEDLKLLAKDKDSRVRIAVARNRNTTEDILKDLAKDTDADVVEAAAEHPNATAKILKEMYENECDIAPEDWCVSGYTRELIASHPNIDNETLREIANNEEEEEEVRYAAFLSLSRRGEV